MLQQTFMRSTLSQPTWNSRRASYNRLFRLRLVSTILTLIFFGLIAMVILGIGLFFWYSRDLPRPDRVRRTEGFSTIIFDRKNVPLYDIFGQENRVPVEFFEIPEHLRNATIAIEDSDFYKHQGFSSRGMARALINIFIFHKLQGGSTLTQQLVKNVLLSGERTLPRKIKEFILAVQIERKYTKNEILQMYLNEAPYGGTTAGVEAASQYYFGKHVSDLTLPESAILAGFPQSPSTYSPVTGDPKAYIWRAEQVLRRMRESDFIINETEDRARAELPNIAFTAKHHDIKAPHFVMYVKKELIDHFGEALVEGGGLRVTTTIDYSLQSQAEKIVAEEIEKVKDLRVGNGAAVVLDPRTGEILSMVGSKDYFATESGNFNATLGHRQPGSAIKPITYAAAFKRGYTPATIILDVETHFPGGNDKKDYIPKNYDGKFRGPIQLRYALGNSINVTAVKLQALVGVKEMLKLGYDLGLTTLEPTQELVDRVGLSVVLGGGEVRLLDLASAFGVFATSGERHDPIAILKVTDSSGKVLWDNKPGRGRRVLSPEVSFLVSSILADNDARKDIFGERGHLLIPGKTVSVKTGTTDDKRDNWTIGYTHSRCVGVWVGNNDNTAMHPSLASGVTGAAPIWNRIMKEALKDIPDEPWDTPAGIVSAEIDAFGGGTPADGYPKRVEYFVKGTEPTSISPVYIKFKVSKSQGDKLANSSEIALGNFEEKEFVVFEEKDPVSTDGKNRWQEGIDDWVNKQSDGKYHPPKETSSGQSQGVTVTIEKPNDHQQLDDHDVRIEATAVSIEEVKRLEIEVDGVFLKSSEGSKISEVINLDTGSHRIKVRAKNIKDDSGEQEIRIGVKVPWDH